MTDWKREWKPLAGIVALLLLFFWLPVRWERFTNGVLEALHLARWYAREHVVLCLLPAFFLAGAIGVFISKASVMKYLGAGAGKVVSYGVASVSGSVLAVCSCTVLPLFAGIWRMGAGLGPATTFLYSGPAINVLAVILTARILGLELGIARAVGAVVFSVVIGLAMHWIYRNEERERAEGQMALPEKEDHRPLWQNAIFLLLMLGVLVFANWGAPGEYYFQTSDGQGFRGTIVRAPFDPSVPGATYTIHLEASADSQPRKIQLPAADIVTRTPIEGAWSAIWSNKWPITACFAGALGIVLIFWIGVAWWKVLLATVAPTVLALSLPMEGMWVLLPFATAVAGLGVILETSRGEGREWFEATWGFAKQILPLLLIGVLLAGFLLGRPGQSGFIPARYVEMLLGNSPQQFLEASGWLGGSLEAPVRAIWDVWTNLFASLFGAMMYFATLTEVPILQGLIGAGMGKGPALAMLLAGPALSLPNMLVIRSVLGTQKTLVFSCLVVVMATISGMIYGTL